MFKEPFYGLFLISLNKEESNRIPTACVSLNGINVQLTINPEYWEKQDPATRIGILKHELLHIVFFHLQNHTLFPDRELGNIACDLEINQYVNKEYKGPSWEGLEIDKYPELALPPFAGSKKYYELLQKANNQRQKNKKGQSQDQGQDGDPGQGQPGQGQPGQGQPGQGGKPSKGSGKGTPADNSKLWDVYDAMKNGQKSIHSHDLWKEFDKQGMSEADKKLIQKQIDHQIKAILDNNEKGRGLAPSELKEYVDGLYDTAEPVINWKSYLRRFVGTSNKSYTKKSRRKYNKRFSENPAIKIKYKKTILIARDTSGSTSAQDHIEFWSEIHHIHKTGVKIMVLDADASCHNIFEYKGKAPIELTGRGGTDFDPAIIYYNEHRKEYHAFIYLTDGECPAPESKPHNGMLWVISSGGTMAYTKDYPGLKVQINR